MERPLEPCAANEEASGTRGHSAGAHDGPAYNTQRNAARSVNQWTLHLGATVRGPHLFDAKISAALAEQKRHKGYEVAEL
jgi:hypothetical protein